MFVLFVRLPLAGVAAAASVLFPRGVMVRVVLVLGSWGKTMREAFRNKERWKGRRASTQDPSTDHLLSRTDPLDPDMWLLCDH